MLITSPAVQTTYFVRMHQRNSHQHHYFRIDVSGGRDETTDRVSQLKHYPILSSLIIYFSADQTWSSTWSILLYQIATGLHFFDIPDASLILVIFSPPHFFLLGLFTCSPLRRTFLRARTIPLQAYTLLCKNTHWPACAWLQTTGAHTRIWSACVCKHSLFILKPIRWTM